MFKPLICTALVLATGLAFAADAPGEREARRAEWQAKADARFADADKDKDGRLDKVEAQAFGERFNELFDRMDANSDGELSKEELAEARQRMRHGRGGRHAGMAFMHGLVIGMDDDGDGAVSRAELGDKMPRWKENFAIIDADGDGKLSRDELRAAGRAAREGHAGHAGPREG